LKKQGWLVTVWRWLGMKSRPTQPQTPSAAQKGLVVQRVIVEGWTIAAAASVAGVPEHLVASWVADFRRHGMASLRHRPGRPPASQYVDRGVLRVRLITRVLGRGLRWLLALDRPLPSLPIRRSGDDRRGGP
jgi:Helix-turn-helix domain